MKSRPTSAAPHPPAGGPDDALLLRSSILKRCSFISEGGKRAGFAGRLSSHVKGHSLPIRAESGRLPTNPVRARVCRLLAVKVG